MHIPLNLFEAIRVVVGQFRRLPSYPTPTQKFSGKTIIVTGANTGLGLEAARHFVRLGASRVILAVRDQSRGEAAASSIAESTGRVGIAEVWHLDLTRRESVEEFAKKVEQDLDRVDVVVENAGVMTKKFEMEEGGNERTVTVNVINTLYLGVLLLPKLRESAAMGQGGREVVLTFVGSFVHFLTWFPERKVGQQRTDSGGKAAGGGGGGGAATPKTIFEGLADRSKARMSDRYYVSKMMEMLLVRELAEHVTTSRQKEGQGQGQGRITVSTVNPGWVVTDLQREGMSWLMALGRRFVARDTELGSRTLVHAALGGEETHGQYLSDCRVDQVSGWVRSKDGMATQKRLWAELMELLERENPDVRQCL